MVIDSDVDIGAVVPHVSDPNAGCAKTCASRKGRKSGYDIADFQYAAVRILYDRMRPSGRRAGRTSGKMSVRLRVDYGRNAQCGKRRQRREEPHFEEFSFHGIPRFEGVRSCFAW